jgi:predicted metal-binding protein
MANHTLFVCELCRFSRTDNTWEGRSGGALLNDQLDRGLTDRELNDALRVVQVRCMGACRRHCMLAFSSPGKLTFLFGDLRPGDDATASAVLDFAEGYVQLADGKVPYKQRDPLLQQGMVAVLPPLIETPECLQSLQSH